MPLPHLDNLVRIGQFKAEPAAQVEIDGHPVIAVLAGQHCRAGGRLTARFR
jgi:hypothetical protein